MFGVPRRLTLCGSMRPGRGMQDSDWHLPFAKVLGVRLNGRMPDELDDTGRMITRGNAGDPLQCICPILSTSFS